MSANGCSREILAELRDVRKHYAKVLALDGVDLALRGGELTALLGPNGAGKTTAIRLLLGLDLAESGQATLFGVSPHTLATRRQIGVMLQAAGIPEAFKVGELIELTRGYYPEPRTMVDCVALAGLDGLLDRRYGKLSGGQQRRVQFALALCGRPRLLFLDEPTTGLDIEARQGLWKAIRELVADGCSVLLTTHYLEEAEALADRVVVLNSGRIIAEGSVEEVRSRVSQRRIRCISTLNQKDVADWPEVLSVKCTAERFEIIADRAEPVVRRLLDEDADLQELEVERAGLAEAFVELTREVA